jgi:hypothetical protein
MPDRLKTPAVAGLMGCWDVLRDVLAAPSAYCVFLLLGRREGRFGLVSRTYVRAFVVGVERSSNQLAMALSVRPLGSVARMERFVPAGSSICAAAARSRCPRAGKHPSRRDARSEPTVSARVNLGRVAGSTRRLDPFRHPPAARGVQAVHRRTASHPRATASAGAVAACGPSLTCPAPTWSESESGFGGRRPVVA